MLLISVWQLMVLCCWIFSLFSFAYIFHSVSLSCLCWKNTRGISCPLVLFLFSQWRVSGKMSKYSFFRLTHWIASLTWSGHVSGSMVSEFSRWPVCVTSFSGLDLPPSLPTWQAIVKHHHYCMLIMASFCTLLLKQFSVNYLQVFETSKNF